MVSFYLNLVNLVIPVFLVNLLILQDAVILLNLVILLKKKWTQGFFRWNHPPSKLTVTIFFFFFADGYQKIYYNLLLSLFLENRQVKVGILYASRKDGSFGAPEIFQIKLFFALHFALFFVSHVFCPQILPLPLPFTWLIILPLKTGQK